MALGHILNFFNLVDMFLNVGCHFAHFFENGNKVKIPSEIKLPTFDCFTECKKTPGCVGFTFVSSIDRCDLKTDDQAVELDYSYGDSIFSGTLKLRPGTGWHNSRGSINSIDEVRAEKASQCEKPCRDTSGCVGWTYVKVSHYGNTDCGVFKRGVQN